MASSWWTHDLDRTGSIRGPIACAACRDALRAGAEHVAALASRGPERCGGHGLCHRHLRRLLAHVPEAERAAVVATLLHTAAAAAAARRHAAACTACWREDGAARRAPADQLCLPHLRRFAGHVGWERLAAASSRVLQVVERGRGGELIGALGGHPELMDLAEDGHPCPVCEARAGARLRHYEWLADAVLLSPSRAAGGAVALCAGHGRAFAAWAPKTGRVLLELVAGAWAERMRLLLAGLDHRPPERLVARLATLPATLSGMADEEGRLPLADVVRATLAAALRTPATVLGRLTAAAFGTGRCPACAAEEEASREAAVTCRVAVCRSDLDLVDSASSTRSARRAVGRATADRLEREAAAARAGGCPVDRATGLAATRAVRTAW